MSDLCKTPDNVNYKEFVKLLENEIIPVGEKKECLDLIKEKVENNNKAELIRKRKLIEAYIRKLKKEIEGAKKVKILNIELENIKVKISKEEVFNNIKEVLRFA